MKKDYSKPVMEQTAFSIEDVLTSSQPAKNDNREYNAKDFSDVYFGGDWSNWDLGGLT